MASLYADEDFPYPVVIHLRILGHDVVTAQDDGRAGRGIGDPDVLARATSLGRAVLTHNRDDFRKLHNVDPNHSGIVAATRDADVVALGTRIHVAIAPLRSLSGQLIRVVKSNP